jgi:AbrB family looped-hinge helix DNA binding protein
MRITSKGQVTIPLEVRQQLGLLPDTEVEFTIKGRSVILTKAGKSTRRGQRLLAAMRGKASSRLSTDEILSLTRGD